MAIDLGQKPVPDATIIYKFRHLMERHNLAGELFCLVDVYTGSERHEAVPRHDCGCHDHQCARLYKEHIQDEKLGDAPDSRGQPMCMISNSWMSCRTGRKPAGGVMHHIQVKRL